MKFDDIRKTIDDAWKFCFPPLIACIGTILIFEYFYPPTTAFLQRFLTVLQDNAATLENIRQTLEPYGLSTAIPIISLMIIILLLYLVNQTVYWVIGRLPPFYIFDTAFLVERRVSNEFKRFLFRKYPIAESFNRVYFLALQDNVWSKEDPDSSKSPSPAVIYFRLHAFIKFFFVTGIIAFIVSLHEGYALTYLATRLLFFVLFVLLIWFFALMGLVYEMEDAEMKILDSLEIKMSDGYRDFLLDLKKNPVVDEAEDRKLEPSKAGNTRWWHIKWLKKGSIVWLKDALFPS